MMKRSGGGGEHHPTVEEVADAFHVDLHMGHLDSDVGGIAQGSECRRCRASTSNVAAAATCRGIRRSGRGCGQEGREARHAPAVLLADSLTRLEDQFDGAWDDAAAALGERGTLCARKCHRMHGHERMGAASQQQDDVSNFHHTSPSLSSNQIMQEVGRHNSGNGDTKHSNN